MKFYLVLFLVLFASCSRINNCQRKINKISRKCPELFSQKNDTVKIDTTLFGFKLKYEASLKEKKSLQDYISQLLFTYTDSVSKVEEVKTIESSKNDSLIIAALSKKLYRQITNAVRNNYYTDTISVDTLNVTAKAWVYNGQMNLIVQKRQQTLNLKKESKAKIFVTVTKEVSPIFYKDYWFWIAIALFLLLIFSLLRK